MNRRKLLGLGILGTAAIAAPAVAAACAVMPRRIRSQGGVIEGQVIDGALTLEGCSNVVISNCSFELQERPKYSIYAKSADRLTVRNVISYW